MSIFYFYFIIGLVLIIVEIMTTTFYVLVIGIAFVLSSIIAIYIHNWLIITGVAVILSVLGCFVVRQYKSTVVSAGSLMINHVGQEVEIIEIMETMVRVRYSGSFWDAQVVNMELSDVKIGDRLIIKKFYNNKLEVSK